MPFKYEGPASIIYLCRRCWQVLELRDYRYENREKYLPPPTPGQVSKRLGGRCPSCGAPIDGRPARIEIRPLWELDISDAALVGAALKTFEGASGAGRDGRG